MLMLVFFQTNSKGQILLSCLRWFGHRYDALLYFELLYLFLRIYS